MSSPYMWSDGFWAEGFWSDGFWGSEQAEDTGDSAGGRPRRRARPNADEEEEALAVILALLTR